MLERLISVLLDFSVSDQFLAAAYGFLYKIASSQPQHLENTPSFRVGIIVQTFM